MKNLIILLIVSLTLMCCKSPQILPSKEQQTTVKDSTFVTRKVVDTMEVLRPADTASIRMLLSKLTSKPTVVTSKQATVSLRKVGNEIQADCECTELKEAIKIYKETIHYQKQIITELRETNTVIQNEMNFLQKLFFYIGLAVAGFFLISVFVRFAIPGIQKLRSK